MILNEVLVRQNFINKILLKNENVELPKGLKVKVMSMRITLNKFRNNFDQDVQEAIKELKTPEYEALVAKEDRSEEEELEMTRLNEKLTDEYNAFVAEKVTEEVIFDKKFTESEYADIMEVNIDNDIDFNGQSIKAIDFLEIIYSLFVEEN